MGDFCVIEGIRLQVAECGPRRSSGQVADGRESDGFLHENCAFFEVFFGVFFAGLPNKLAVSAVSWLDIFFCGNA